MSLFALQLAAQLGFEEPQIYEHKHSIEGKDSMQDTIYRCDVCGAQKDEGNHWFAVDTSACGFQALPWDFAVKSRSEAIEDSEHICGQECVHKRLNQWLENINRPTPATEGEN